MNRMGIRSSPGATSSQRQVNAPADREVQLGDITNFAVTAYLAELTDSPRSIPGFTVIAVARPDESRVNVTCQPNDHITKLVSDLGTSSCSGISWCCRDVGGAEGG